MKEVKYGKWTEQEEPYIGTYECSNCKRWFVLEDGTPEENNYNYCPNCGADMKGKLTHAVEELENKIGVKK